MANLPHLAASPLFLALLDATVNPAVLHEPHLGVGVSLAALTPPSGVPGLGLWGFGLVALGVLSVGGGLTGTRLAATAAALLISSAPLGGEGVLGLWGVPTHLLGAGLAWCCLVGYLWAPLELLGGLAAVTLSLGSLLLGVWWNWGQSAGFAGWNWDWIELIPLAIAGGWLLSHHLWARATGPNYALAAAALLAIHRNGLNVSLHHAQPPASEFSWTAGAVWGTGPGFAALSADAWAFAAVCVWGVWRVGVGCADASYFHHGWARSRQQSTSTQPRPAWVAHGAALGAAGVLLLEGWLPPELNPDGGGFSDVLCGGVLGWGLTRLPPAPRHGSGVLLRQR